MPQTPVILYRRGNSQTPRMDNVRDDVATYIDDNGEECVIAKSGGISCWEFTPCPGRSFEWMLPTGTEYPYDLYLRRDEDVVGHWSWEPDVDMPMARYKDWLLTLGLNFSLVKVS